MDDQIDNKTRNIIENKGTLKICRDGCTIQKDYIVTDLVVFQTKL